MSQEITGSKFKSDDGPGQNGDKRASSSTTLGTKQPANGDWQTRRVHNKGEVPIHPASRDVNANPKSVGTKVDRRRG